MFPLKNYKYELPKDDHYGAFGTKRKFDMHTGVDLYCDEGDDVFAIEDGEVVAIEWFTGPSINMPWWNDTKAVAVKGTSGIINYGEIVPNKTLEVGDNIKEGAHIGWVTPVLKKDKGKVPSTSMLHLELYSEYNGQWSMWELGQEQPSNLLNPTKTLHSALKQKFKVGDKLEALPYHKEEFGLTFVEITEVNLKNEVYHWEVNHVDSLGMGVLHSGYFFDEAKEWNETA
jgi:murein DD-endopeptidase MepM/ murein hydrolase activator NlpD